MKIKKKDLIKYIVIGVVLLGSFSLIIILLGKNKKEDNIDLNQVSDNLVVDDDIAMVLYERYNPERGLLFELIGSDTNKDYYGYYYRKAKISYDDLDGVVKNTILINDADYRTGEYNEVIDCYYMGKDSFETIYKKLYGHDDYNFEFDDNYLMNVIVEDDKICIGNSEGNGYTKVIDTYMVNAVNKGDYISIYERVAFIKIEEDYLSFYKDYKMRKLIYKLEISDKVDRSFINNSAIVSNVLLKYQDKFDLYEYTYKKGVDSYYFESIER